jgi:hypothetical protein
MKVLIVDDQAGLRVVSRRTPDAKGSDLAAGLSGARLAELVA